MTKEKVQLIFLISFLNRRCEQKYDILNNEMSCRFNVGHGAHNARSTKMEYTRVYTYAFICYITLKKKQRSRLMMVRRLVATEQKRSSFVRLVRRT